MKEIKFRGKRIDCNEWEYGDFSHWKEENGKERTFISLGGLPPFEVKPDTVGQFTGLRDKNGTEIYEGDILRVREYYNQCILDMTHEERELSSLNELKGELKKDFTSPVVWEEGCFVISSNGGDYNDYSLSVLYGNMKHSQPIFEFEVIGNIYDNPELLKKN